MATIGKRSTAAGVRYDVRWRLPDGTHRKRTFRTKDDARNYVKKLGGDEIAGLVIDPNAGEISLDKYIESWFITRLVKGRPLSPATLQGYRALYRRNLEPLGALALNKITVEVVRTWHAQLVDSSGHDQAAKSYRLLRAVMATAVEDGRKGQNPCRIRGAGIEQAAERPIIDATTIVALADGIVPRLRALVMLGGFGGLRTGEMLALTRADVDVLHRTVKVRASASEITGHGRIVGSPKTDAGFRTVALPRVAVEALERHLGAFGQPGPDGFVFTGPRGGPLRRADLSLEWRAAVAKVPSAPAGLHVHDLRHAGATLMARMPGVTTKELMSRIGHASPRAALIYQHATEERDRAVADYLDAQISTAKPEPVAPVVELRTSSAP